jgi:hypothetical protein
MAVKKTIKRTVKKRRKARKVEPIDSVIASLESNASLSAVNKRALTLLGRTDAAVARMEKQVATAAERVSKAAASAANVKTPAAKEKAKLKVADARAKLKEVKASMATAVAERKKSERLARGLHKSLVAAQAKMAKEFDKMAKATEKAMAKTTRRRRTRKKRAVKAS